MKTRLACLMTLALMAAFAVPAAAQTLGDAARLEAERRAKVKESGKVIKTEDVKSDRPAPSAPGEKPAATDDAAAAAAAAKPAGEKEAATGAAAKDGDAVDLKSKIRDKRPEEHWRERAKVLRDRLDRLHSDAMAIEGRIEALQAQLQSASAGQAAALSSEIEQATKDLERFRREHANIQEEWDRFEARAAQAKIPASWIR